MKVEGRGTQATFAGGGGQQAPPRGLYAPFSSRSRARVAASLLLGVSPARLGRHLSRLLALNREFFWEVLDSFLPQATTAARVAAWRFLIALPDEMLRQQ